MAEVHADVLPVAAGPGFRLEGDLRDAGQVSDLGKFIDPLADSVSRFTVFLCFLAQGFASVWVVAILFWRDSIVASLRILGATRGVIISARWSGKVKAWFQGTAIITTLVFCVWPDLFGLGWQDVPTLSQILCWIVAAYTFYSLVDYLWGNRQVLDSLSGSS